ncbi:MAG: DUF6128 domain-containing protein [Schaedlerella sp.]|nr:DUF6128 domain-containing protein [Schaedlerella sp.]
MKPGVYYLYEYKNNLKSKNVGFLKYTQNSDICFLQICARGISVFHNESSSLSVLYLTENGITAIPGGSVTCENHAITCRTKIPLQSLDTSLSPDEICGFVFKLSDENYIAATKENIDFSLQKISSPSSISSPINECKNSIKTELPNETIYNKSLDEKPVTNDIPDSQTSPELSARKIHRSELSLLPRRYWHLANNNFLMHGYYNYNHLLLIKNEDHFLLGVPGIYDKREARAADSFGFPAFSETYNKILDLSREEISPHGTFGYWCRKIPLI